MKISDLQKLCYGRSLAAGWWTDIKTGRAIERDVNTALVKLALIHSELSESLFLQ